MATDRQIKQAISDLNNSLSAHQKLTGNYPRQLICDLVDEWYEQNDGDAESVAEVIEFLRNKKHRATAIMHLEKISVASLESKQKSHAHFDEHSESQKKGKSAYTLGAIAILIGFFGFFSLVLNLTIAFYVFLYMGILFAIGIIFKKF